MYLDEFNKIYLAPILHLADIDLNFLFNSGFIGDTCQINVNDCVSNPCLNGGTCEDLIGGFKCLCSKGSISHLPLALMHSLFFFVFGKCVSENIKRLKIFAGFHNNFSMHI